MQSKQTPQPSFGLSLFPNLLTTLGPCPRASADKMACLPMRFGFHSGTNKFVITYTSLTILTKALGLGMDQNEIEYLL